MVTAHLHDDSTLEVSTRGDGPAVVVPVGTALLEGEAAERIRAWGTDPNLGHTLAIGLADAGFRVITADYEGHLAQHPKARTLTATAVAADLLAVADAAGADRFAYYGYSWLALAGLQLATRTDRLAALAMGGFPPLDGPYGPMLTVTHASHREAVANVGKPPSTAEVQPGDWDSAETTQAPEQIQQYVTLYESLRGFDERAALGRLDLPRLVFAGADDNIRYGPRWDNAYVAIADAVRENRDELTKQGWAVELVAGTDHMSAMQADKVLPLLVPWLRRHWC
ncbi:alpha/beta hydrolase [Actinoplanes sp. ATCC 53533]|uniref:alpha/beta hydrolase n=1 Tax=Actinoplanes sp. ATCC 53533 TaxID=1288362 RepID=UPI000F79B466|nr:alpha/beta hydrolase [Actinoplanes sp. ATCC 53533]RSM58226.1 alpha/beta hydrolase [Actinoplanes sp. ATCC 53533]